MLSNKGVIDLLNDKSRVVNPLLNKWTGVYYGMSLHIAGACPSFIDYRFPETLDTTSNDPKNIIRRRVQPVNYYGLAYDLIFDTYLFNRHPRENDKTRNWRKSQYRPITKAPFQKAIEVTMGAIFQDSNYSIEVDNKADNDYIWGNNFNGQNLVNYFSSKFQTICEDPNGIFVVIPKEPMFATTTAQIEPEIVFINSKNIIHVSDDEIVFSRPDYIWNINNIGLFRYQQNDKSEYFHVDEKYGGYFFHMMGSIPKMIGGGNWNTQGFYDSWLDKAKPIADDYIASKSAEQLVDKEASHPWIIAVNTDCPDCVNSSGSIQVECADCPGGVEIKPCPTCHGSGEISRNPGDWMTVPQDMIGKGHMLEIVNPDTAINTYHHKKCQDLYQDLLSSLHLNYIEQAQSGVAKDKDMETRYQFINKISTDIFDRLIPEALDNITSYRNVAISEDGVLKPTPSHYTIVKPTQYQIKTSNDLLNDFDVSTKANMPAFVRVRQVNDYVDKQFGGDETMKRKTELITQLDFMSVLTSAEKQSMVIGGGATSRDWQYSNYLPVIIDDIIRQNGKEWFEDQPFDSIKTEIDIRFAAISPIVSTTKATETATIRQNN